MSDWYRELDLLPGGIEQVIPANSALHATVERVMNDTGLAQGGGAVSEVESVPVAARTAETDPVRPPPG